MQFGGSALDRAHRCRAPDRGRDQPRRDAAGTCLPPTLRVWVELVAGVADLLAPGGMLLLHDYGFTTPFIGVEHYAPLPPSHAGLRRERVTRDGSENGFPRGFFRVFGNDEQRVDSGDKRRQLRRARRCARAGRGAVTMIPHGNMILNQGGTLQQGDGVFLSEFGLLEPGDDISALLTRLHAEPDPDPAGVRRALHRWTWELLPRPRSTSRR